MMSNLCILVLEISYLQLGFHWTSVAPILIKCPVNQPEGNFASILTNYLIGALLNLAVIIYYLNNKFRRF